MMASDAFFRSLNLAEDLAHPERFLHYHPTSRALPIVASVARPSAATMIIAPYGSGKSLAAGVGALFVANKSEGRTERKAIAERIGTVDPDLGSALARRADAGVEGGVIILAGYVPDPLAAIASVIGMPQSPRSVEGLRKTMHETGWDHCAIIWDEFGRHLEALVADGRSADLDIVQRLAERATRADDPSLSLTLLLHQNLLSYATRLNETSRTEWRKIEGRFETLRLIEDSQEFYELVGEVVETLRPEETAAHPVQPKLPAAIIEAGWLDGMKETDRVGRLLQAAYPLTPGALQVLPTLVARVGQNERSLFTFLREQKLGARVGIEEVYSAFSDAMRTDVGIGGTHRRWVETESARSRAATPLARELLAAACLLQLGAGGERRRVARHVVELAVADGQTPQKDIAQSFDALLKANLLLWRRHNDDVAVWHGADIDVALRVREERERRVGDFDLVQFLEQRFPAPHLRGSGHNADFGVNRFLDGRYVSPQMLADGVLVPPETSGIVAYLLVRDQAAVTSGQQAAQRFAKERLILVVPERPLDIEGAALELVAIEALRKDSEFLASDPMIPTEIDELHSVAFEQLAVLMRVLLDPGGTQAHWYSGGERLPVTAEYPASVSASRLLGKWYSSTPRIANEQLMRGAASRTMQTARVRVVTSILERSERLRLGYEDGDGSAEASIYRTVIEKSGLRKADATRFADPDAIAEKGLAEVWRRIGAYFSKPTKGKTARPLAAFLDNLAAPPIGLPRAIMPVLLAAGFQHFARAVALYKDGSYVPDILGFSFDAMVASPEGFGIRVLDLTPALADYLCEFTYAFTHERPGPHDELVRQAHDAVVGWLLTVPDGSRRSTRLQGRPRALLRAAGETHDPIDLIVEKIPNLFGDAPRDARLVAEIETARTAIDRLRDVYAEEAVAVIGASFARYGGEDGPVDAIKAWANCFSLEALDRNQSLRIVDRSVVSKALETENGRFSEKSLANTLSSILLQRSLDKWDDRTAAQFQTALREARDRVEAAALDTAEPSPVLRPILAAKLDELGRMLAKIDAAEEIERGGRVILGVRR